MIRLKFKFVTVSTATYRDQSRYAASQWETSLQCSDVSYWLSSYLDQSLHLAEGELFWQGTQDSPYPKNLACKTKLDIFQNKLYRNWKKICWYLFAQLIVSLVLGHWASVIHCVPHGIIECDSVHDRTQQSPEPMLTSHKWGFCGTHHQSIKNCSKYQFVKWDGKLHL